MLRDITGPAGPLEALLEEPAERRGVSSDGLVHLGTNGRIRAAVVLAHPHPQYGGTMHTKAVYQSAKALARIEHSERGSVKRDMEKPAGEGTES